MKQALLMSLAATLLVASGLTRAQDRIYRCGNEYTNAPAPSQKGKCRLIEGGNVTVVQRQHFVAPVRVAAAPQPGQRVGAPEQRARDADARQILEAELRRAEARQADLRKEYNNGEPEKLGPETRNHQKYLDRVAELKASIDRNESDIAGIRRELGRIPEPK